MLHQPLPAAADAPAPATLAPDCPDPGARPPPPRRKPLSEILSDIAADPAREFVAIADLIATLGGRGRAALILLFAVPNVLPAPPGVSGLLGLPLLYLAVQMMQGRLPWLPQVIGARGMPRDRFARLVARLSPLLARAERLLRPRWPVLVSHRAERGLGAACLVLALVLVLPIPLGNMLPALAICLVALGVLERDGVWVLAGLATGALSLLIVGGVVLALAKAAIFLVLNVLA